jgi:hypothetical protein
MDKLIPAQWSVFKKSEMTGRLVFRSAKPFCLLVTDQDGIHTLSRYGHEVSFEADRLQIEPVGSPGVIYVSGATSRRVVGDEESFTVVDINRQPNPAVDFVKGRLRRVALRDYLRAGLDPFEVEEQANDITETTQPDGDGGDGAQAGSESPKPSGTPSTSDEAETA